MVGILSVEIGNNKLRGEFRGSFDLVRPKGLKPESDSEPQKSNQINCKNYLFKLICKITGFDKRFSTHVFSVTKS